MTLRGRLTAAACVAACALTGAAPASALEVGVSVPAPAHGCTGSAQWTPRIASSGIRLIRVPLEWSRSQPSRGARIDAPCMDELALRAARDRVDMVVILSGPSPPWATSAPKASARGMWPPRRPSDLAAFAAAAVGRYGPGGSLWAEHPDVPARPVRAWQVWNEPNMPDYWPAGPDARQYARMLAAVAPAIRAADRGATVIAAGYPDRYGKHGLLDWTRDLYRAGADRHFDRLAIHPYARGAAGVIAAVSDVRAIMRRNGDRRPMWLTELGWASGGAASPFTVTAAGQAARLGRTLDRLAARRDLRVEGAVVYQWRDTSRRRNAWWAMRTGLLDFDGKAKPALRAVARRAR